MNVLSSNDAGMFVDTFDQRRRAFCVQAAQELQVEEQTIKKNLGRVLSNSKRRLDRRRAYWHLGW